VNDGGLTGGGLVTVAHDDVLDQEVIGGRSEVGINEWFL
jgi:hypothetical protein